MSQLIFDKAKEKTLLVAHRGSFMGNIPCNVIPAYRAALLAGAASTSFRPTGCR